jgi:hypothetical protein
MTNSDNVFVNCPFDNAYFPLLKPLLFTLIYLRLRPKISETADSGQIRLHTIKNLMAASRYSIHDLSRMEPISRKEYPRFNMPFECGIDFGLRMADEAKYGNKRFLILEKEPHRYQKVMSDIAGNDIKAHSNEPEQMVKAVRDWFKPTRSAVPSYKEIWLAYNEFEYHYEQILTEQHYDPNDIAALTFTDIIENMEAWVKVFKERG